MATTMTLNLGEVSAKYKPKYFKIPKLKAEFELTIDTGHSVTDKALGKQMSKAGKKVLLNHLKSRMKGIDKALKAQDKDIDSRKKEFLKSEGISSKAESLTPEQYKAYGEYMEKIKDLIGRLQEYLNQILDGINKSDSKKWISDALEACYSKMKKMLKKYSFKRSSGGRAKIIILGTLAVIGAAAGIAAGIAATVASGGAALPLVIGIGAIVGGALSTLGAAGTLGVNLLKTRNKLQGSVKKLGEDVEAIQGLLNQCEEASKNYVFKGSVKDKIAWAKEYGINSKEYTKRVDLFGANSKPKPEVFYSILKGQKSVFKKYSKHYKDVEVLSLKINQDIDSLKDKIAKIKAEVKKAEDQAVKASSAEAPSKNDAKKIQATVDKVKELKGENAKLETSIENMMKERQKLDKMVQLSGDIETNFEKYGFVARNVATTKASLKTAETIFGDMSNIGTSLGKMTSGAGSVKKSVESMQKK